MIITLTISDTIAQRVSDAICFKFNYDSNKQGAETRSDFTKRMCAKILRELVLEVEKENAQPPADKLAQWRADIELEGYIRYYSLRFNRTRIFERYARRIICLGLRQIAPDYAALAIEFLFANAAAAQAEAANIVNAFADNFDYANTKLPEETKQQFIRRILTTMYPTANVLDLQNEVVINLDDELLAVKTQIETDIQVGAS